MAVSHIRSPAHTKHTHNQEGKGSGGRFVGGARPFVGSRRCGNNWLPITRPDKWHLKTPRRFRSRLAPTGLHWRLWRRRAAPRPARPRLGQPGRWLRQRFDTPSLPALAGRLGSGELSLQLRHALTRRGQVTAQLLDLAARVRQPGCKLAVALPLSSAAPPAKQIGRPEQTVGPSAPARSRTPAAPPPVCDGATR